MTRPPPPTLRLDIDTGALAHNWRLLDAMSGTARAGAAVKADCYGLGVGKCVPALLDAGCRDFFVAHWSEVADVIDHIPPGQLSVLHGPLNAQDAAYARETRVVPVIVSIAQARLWNETGGGPCHLMVDTGINRLGIAPGEVGEDAIQALDVQVLMSHLACADDDSPMNGKLLDAIRNVIPLVRHREVSLANSAGIGLGGAYHFDLTRPGLALYGGVPTGAFADEIRQVAYPRAALIQTRELMAGQTVGYNATFTAPRNMRVGVVSLGYADGILRSWAGAHFIGDGAVLPMLGKVSMDMIVVDLSDAPQLREGDWVELPYCLPDAARQTALSQYELLTVLGRRLRS